MTTVGPPSPADALLRAALLDHLETVMTVTDTERELERFHATVRRSDGRRRLLAAAASVAVLAAAGGTYLAVRDGTSTPTLAGTSGSMVLDLKRSSLTASPSEATNQDEIRDHVLEGPLTFVADGTEHTTTLTLEGAAGLVPTSTGPRVYHSWGTARATVDGTACEGTYALSFYHQPREAGGALQLSCADGSALGGTLVTERIAEAPRTRVWQLEATLEDGFLVAP